MATYLEKFKAGRDYEDWYIEAIIMSHCPGSFVEGGPMQGKKGCKACGITKKLKKITVTDERKTLIEKTCHDCWNQEEKLPKAK